MVNSIFYKMYFQTNMISNICDSSLLNAISIYAILKAQNK